MGAGPTWHLSPRRPALRAVQNTVDPHVIRPHRVNDYVRRTGHDHLAGSRDAPGAAAARVVREERHACRDFVRKGVGGTWVALADILELLFEIAFRSAQPDDPQRPRSGLAFLISSAPRAFHFRTTSS